MKSDLCRRSPCPETLSVWSLTCPRCCCSRCPSSGRGGPPRRSGARTWSQRFRNSSTRHFLLDASFVVVLFDGPGYHTALPGGEGAGYLIWDPGPGPLFPLLPDRIFGVISGSEIPQVIHGDIVNIALKQTRGLYRISAGDQVILLLQALRRPDHVIT